MIQLVQSIGKWMGQVLALPFTAVWKRSSASGLAWLAHVGLLLLILVGLGWLNQWLRIDMAVQAPSQLLRQLWLPLMGLVAYGMAWCIWWTWLVWRQPGPLSPFPDIQEAWTTALAGLEEHDLSVTDRPVFLLLGTTTSNEQDVLASLEIDSTFGPRPSQPTAPVRVIADQQAIYISVPGVSSVAAQAERWYEKGHHALQPKAALQDSLATGGTGEVERAIPVALQAVAPTAVATTSAVPAATRSGAEMGADIEQAETQLQSAMEITDDWLFQSGESESPAEEECLAEFTLSTQTCDTKRARLAYVSSLVREARQGRAPFDGVSLFLPGDSLATHGRAEVMSRLARGDLETLSEAAGAVAPVVCAVTDLDAVQGCGEVIKRLPPSRQQLLLGSELPLEEEAANDHRAIVSKVDKIGTELIPALCSRLYEAGTAPSSANRRLFSFQHSLALRQPKLTSLIAEIATKCHTPWSIAGCYLVATGHFDPEARGFGGRVLSRLLELKGRANWTAEAVEADRTCRRWARYTWGVAAALVICAVLAVL